MAETVPWPIRLLCAPRVSRAAFRGQLLDLRAMWPAQFAAKADPVFRPKKRIFGKHLRFECSEKATPRADGTWGGIFGTKPGFLRLLFRAKLSDFFRL